MMDTAGAGPALDPIEDLFWNHPSGSSGGPGLNLSTNGGLDLTIPNYEGLNLSQQNVVLNLTQHQQQHHQQQLGITVNQEPHRPQHAEEDGLDLSLQNGMNLTRQVQDAGNASSCFNYYDPNNYTTNDLMTNNQEQRVGNNSPLNLEQHRSSPLNLTAVQQQKANNYFQHDPNQGYYYQDYQQSSNYNTAGASGFEYPGTNVSDSMNYNYSRSGNNNDLQSINLTSCVYCGEQFRDESLLLKHLNSPQGSNCYQNFVLPEDPQPSTSFETPPAVLTSSTAVAEVWNENSFSTKDKVDVSSKPFKCDICGTKYSSKKSLGRHQDRVHKDVQKKFNCGTCAKSFHNRSELARHEKYHYSSKACEKCGKKIYKGRSKRHVCKKNGKIVTEFPCEICGAFLDSKTEWSCHMWVHTKDPKYVPIDVSDASSSEDDEKKEEKPKETLECKVSPPKAHAVNSYSQLNPLCLQTSGFVKENEEKPLNMQIVQANKTATATA